MARARKVVLGGDERLVDDVVRERSLMVSGGVFDDVGLEQQVLDGLLAGLSVRKIAVELGIDEGRVRVLAERALRSSEVLGDVVKNRLRLQLLRIDEAYRVVRDQILGGRMEAVHALVKLMEREAKLLGLDSAEKRVVEHRLSPLEQFAKAVFGKPKGDEMGVLEGEEGEDDWVIDASFRMIEGGQREEVME